MKTYSEFSPTGFDTKGAFLRDQQNWLVVGVSQTRDSEPLDQSNFATALEMLGGESDTVEVHRFGHWGPGWFEIIIIDPKDTDRVKVAEEIEESLTDYPVLDETDFSRREWEESEKDWDNWAREDFIGKLCEDFGLTDATRDFLEDCDSGELRRFLDDYARQYVPICLRSFNCTRAQLAAFLRAQRRPQPAA